MRRCFECGQPLGKKDVFCPRSGARQRRELKEEIDRINMINSDATPLFKGFVLVIQSNPVNPVNPVYCF
jgi:uncharacterized Zn finger protein (UPF0148 family)